MKKILIFLIVFILFFLSIFRYVETKEKEEILKIEPESFLKEYILPGVEKLISIWKLSIERIKNYPIWNEISKEYKKRKEIAKEEIERKKGVFLEEFLSFFKNLFGKKKQGNLD